MSAMDWLFCMVCTSPQKFVLTAYALHVIMSFPDVPRVAAVDIEVASSAPYLLSFAAHEQTPHWYVSTSLGRGFAPLQNPEQDQLFPEGRHHAALAAADCKYSCLILFLYSPPIAGSMHTLQTSLSAHFEAVHHLTIPEPFQDNLRQRTIRATVIQTASERQGFDTIEQDGSIQQQRARESQTAVRPVVQGLETSHFRPDAAGRR